MHHLSWLEAVVIGLVQGVSELFPISSVGHSVLIPALVGGSWAKDLDVADPESPYLAFIVALHVATALALIAYFWRDWVRIVRGFLTSLRDREVRDADQRLAWLLILASIPVGVIGLVFEHTFRVRFGRPLPAALFLVVNGFVLGLGELLRRRAQAGAVRTPEAVGVGARTRAAAGAPAGDLLHADDPADRAARAEDAEGDRAVASDRRIAAQGVGSAVAIGTTQILALIAGFSRSGVAMTAGLLRGLSHEDAARFSFLLATPVILAAGVLKIPDLAGPLGRGIHGQAAVGAILSGVAAYISVRFLDRYFQTRTLTPFAVYCVVAGGFCAIRFGLF